MLISALLLNSYFVSPQSFEQYMKRRRTKTVLWALRIWAICSAFLVVTAFLPGLQFWPPAEAVKPSRYELSWTKPSLPEKVILERSTFEAPRVSTAKSIVPLSFQRAPSFQNDKHCRSNSFNSRDQHPICDAASVHIAMTLDAAYLRGSMAAVYSIVKHATCPENIVFHFLICDRDKELKNLVLSTFPYLKFKVYSFSEGLVKSKISLSVRQDLEQPLNYARNYLADILEPCIEKVIYLDSDLVVVDDIVKLWEVNLGNSAVGAPEYCHANFTKYFTNAFWSNPAFARTFNSRKPCYFNTGVMVMDLKKWRKENYTSRLELWMDIQKAWRIYELGSLPPFLLVFAGSIKAIEHKWNQHGLGGDNIVGSCRPLHPGPVSLLHWSGRGKPWIRLDSGRPCPLDSLWAPYDLFINFKQHQVDSIVDCKLGASFRQAACA